MTLLASITNAGSTAATGVTQTIETLGVGITMLNRVAQAGAYRADEYLMVTKLGTTERVRNAIKEAALDNVNVSERIRKAVGEDANRCADFEACYSEMLASYAKMTADQS